MLSTNGKSGYPFLFLTQVQKRSELSCISMLLAVGVSQMPFVRLETPSCIPSVLGVFITKTMLDFVKCFFCICQVLPWVPPSLFCYIVYNTDF